MKQIAIRVLSFPFEPPRLPRAVDIFALVGIVISLCRRRRHCRRHGNNDPIAKHKILFPNSTAYFNMNVYVEIVDVALSESLLNLHWLVLMTMGRVLQK